MMPRKQLVTYGIVSYTKQDNVNVNTFPGMGGYEECTMYTQHTHVRTVMSTALYT